MRSPPGRAGFTMIEMLIVLAMVAILALTAIPAIKDHAIRRQVKEGLLLANVAKDGVQKTYSATGKIPAGNADAGLPEAKKIVGTMVSEVSVDQGAVTVTFGNNAGASLEGKRVTLRPAVVPNTPVVPIAWICHQVAVPKGMEVLGSDETDIPMSWLPAECRSAESK